MHLAVITGCQPRLKISTISNSERAWISLGRTQGLSAEDVARVETDTSTAKFGNVVRNLDWMHVLSVGNSPVAKSKEIQE